MSPNRRKQLWRKQQNNQLNKKTAFVFQKRFFIEEISYLLNCNII